MSDGFEIEISYQLPTDSDGFFRRQCPTCGGQYKAFGHDDGEEAQVDDHYCPLCGTKAGSDNGEWLTPEQRGHMEAVGLQSGMERLNDELGSIFRSASNRHVKFEQTGGFDEGAAPDELVEPDDMAIVEPPCHGDEPVKVPDHLAGPFHCLLCGTKFAV